MVKIALAGGSGRVARGIIDVLVASNKHEVLILTRKDPTDAEHIPGVTWVKTDYSDKLQLISILSGVHTVLSFIAVHADPNSVAQKTIIDAAVTAGVKRFAPSEWGTSNFEELPWYGEKANVRAYLQEINKEKKVLEYCLFQPGGFLDAFVPERPAELFVDFHNRRAIVLEGQDSRWTLTAVKDLANVVARAIEYTGEWPVVGGIRGTTLPISKIIDIGTKVRGGKPWEVTPLKEQDLRAGKIQSPWVPKLDLPGLPEDQAAAFSRTILIGCLLSGLHEAWAVSDEWNRLLPDYKFTDADEFLTKHWAGIP